MSYVCRIYYEPKTYRSSLGGYFDTANYTLESGRRGQTIAAQMGLSLQ